MCEIKFLCVCMSYVLCVRQIDTNIHSLVNIILSNTSFSLHLSKISQNLSNAAGKVIVLMDSWARSEVGIYKRKIYRKKERKHTFDQEKSKIQEKRKKTR